MARQYQPTRRQFLRGTAAAAAAGLAAVRALVDAEVDLAQLAAPSGGP